METCLRLSKKACRVDGGSLLLEMARGELSQPLHNHSICLSREEGGQLVQMG